MSKPVKYNFQEFKPQLSVSRRTLRKGQASLYDLLVKKLKSGEPVTIKEAKAIWANQVCRYKENEVPYTWVWKYNPVTGKMEYVHRKMTEDEINFNSLNWLTRTIGLLVIKGYIKAIPMVQLV